VSTSSSEGRLKIVVWNEFVQERQGGVPAELYPDGIHTVIAHGLRAALGESAVVRTATLDEPSHGLPDSVLDEADVVVWWGHVAHDQVPDELAQRVQQRVLEGMGLVVLHSAHLSKPFCGLMGTSCGLRWREAGDRELIWTVSPGHPITADIPAVIALEAHEMYGEFFDIPVPDELVFVSSFSGGEVFRSGCCFRRGKGKVFFFSPGHEAYPIYRDTVIQRVIANAVRWAKADTLSGVVLGIQESETGWFER
jgi:trehalose utilization protein